MDKFDAGWWFAQWDHAALRDRFIVWSDWLRAGIGEPTTPLAIDAVFDEMCSRAIRGL